MHACTADVGVAAGLPMAVKHEKPKHKMSSWRIPGLGAATRAPTDLNGRLLHALTEIVADSPSEWRASLREAGFGVFPPAAGSPPTAIQLERLYLACATRLQCDHLGLLIGAQTRLADLAPGCTAALCATNLHDGILALVEHFNLHDSFGMLDLVESGAETKLRFTVCEHGLEHSDQWAILGLAAVHGALRELIGEAWAPSAALLPGNAPASRQPFQAHFRAPLEFDAAESALVFDSALLAVTMPSLDPLQHGACRAAGVEHRAAVLAELPTTLRRLLRKNLARGSISMDEIAGELRMHRRTLDRRLDRFGTTFGVELDSVRRDVARQLLRETTLPVHLVARAVCFSSAANFATAFRRQAGMTPTEYRRRAA